jgi:hypothetical protein
MYLAFDTVWEMSGSKSRVNFGGENRGIGYRALRMRNSRECEEGRERKETREAKETHGPKIWATWRPAALRIVTRMVNAAVAC